MKRRSKKTRPQVKTIRLWSFEQAQKAVPYFRSLTDSLREHWIQAQDARLTANRLAKKTGRPDRARLLAQKDADHDKAETENKLLEVVGELEQLDVFCLDPVGGLMLIPFRQQDELAWFVFDRYEPENLRFWRFHKDDLGTRRPITEEIQHPPAEVSAN